MIKCEKWHAEVKGEKVQIIDLLFNLFFKQEEDR